MTLDTRVITVSRISLCFRILQKQLAAEDIQLLDTKDMWLTVGKGIVVMYVFAIGNSYFVCVCVYVYFGGVPIIVKRTGLN